MSSIEEKITFVMGDVDDRNYNELACILTDIEELTSNFS